MSSRKLKPSYAGDCLKDRDSFGQPVSLQYQGRDKYKTKLGGFCSLIVLAIVLGLLLEFVIQLHTGASYTIFNSTVYFNTKEQLGERPTFKDIQFDLAVGTWDLIEREYVKLDDRFVQI